MNLSLLQVLVCPQCKESPLRVESWLKDGSGRLLSGKLHCGSCRAAYLVINGIPRFVHSDSYASSFSLEWARHAKTQLDSVSGLTVARDTFFQRTGFLDTDLKNKLVLDAGCGIGRYMEVAHNSGARIVGVDMSFSVDQAYENVGHLPNVDIVQADLMHLPFKEQTFDTVFSLGVLHHTPDAHRAFQNIALLPKDGGKLAVWLYANDGLKQRLYNAVAALYRSVTTKMPPELLYKLCGIAVPLYSVHRIPIIGNITRAVIPTSMEPRAEWRRLDTYDWYSPKYQSKHTYGQVMGWFEQAGFDWIMKLDYPASVQGTRDLTRPFNLL